MHQSLNTVESYFEHQVNVQARRFDVERQRVRHLEDMVHHVGDLLGAIVTRAGTKMTAHEVNAAERFEHLESLVVYLVEKVGEVCEYLGLEANKLNRLPTTEKQQAHVTWFGTPWPKNNMDEFLDQVAAAQDHDQPNSSTEDAAETSQPVQNDGQVVASTPPDAVETSHPGENGSQVPSTPSVPPHPCDPVETPIQGGPAAPINLISSPWTPLRLPPRTGPLQTTLDYYIGKGLKKKANDRHTTRPQKK